MHRQGNIGRSVVAVQQKPYGGLRDFGYRLDDGGADIAPGGETHDAIVANDLHVLWDANFSASQELADPDGKPVGVTENAVKFQFSVLNVLLQESEEGGFRVIVAEKQALVRYLNFIAAFQDTAYWQAMGRTAIYSFFAVILINIVAFTLAYLVTSGVKGQNFCRASLPTLKITVHNHG